MKNSTNNLSEQTINVMTLDELLSIPNYSENPLVAKRIINLLMVKVEDLMGEVASLEDEIEMMEIEIESCSGDLSGWV